MYPEPDKSSPRHPILFLPLSPCPLGTSATIWPTLPAPDDDECGAVSAMSGRGNQSARRKPTPVSLCPPQIPHDLIQV
jgi:hypothetical protein